MSTSPDATWDHARSGPVSRSLVRPSRPATASSRPTTTPPGARSSRGSGWVRLIQLCIAHYESHGNPKAVNPNGLYFGRYQFADGLWHGATGLRGHASDYPAAIQDAAFLKVFAGGKGRHRWSTYPMCRAIYGGPA